MAASPLAAALLGGTQGGGFPGAEYMDPEIAQAAPNLQLAQALLSSGLSSAPASPMQAIGRLAQAISGRYLQNKAISGLTQAYAHSADDAAATLPPGHPLRAALESPDPVIRMQGLQAYQKGLVLMSQPSTQSPGQVRTVGSAVIAANTQPRSPEGVLQQDVTNAANQPRGIRNNNPGNIEAGPFASGQPGYAGSDGRFAKFNSPQAGMDAASALLAGYGKQGINTVSGIVNRWAPSSDGNDTGAYASFVAKKLGISPDQPLDMTNPNVRSSLAGAMAEFENGRGAFSAQKAPATSVPTNPLQGAIDTKAAEAGAEESAKNPALVARAGGSAQAENPALVARAGGVKQAEANVEYGDLLKPQAAPPQGPGGTQPLATGHGTTLPPLSEQGALPKTPAEAQPAVETWRKTIDGWNSSLQPGYQAEQRLTTIANVFKTMQTGWGAEQKAQAAAALKSIGITLPDNILGDPAKVEMAIHENYVETLQQLKASTPRFTQMEFRALSENKEHPNLQPAANLQMLSEDIGQLRQARDLPRDFVIAQQHGWRDPQSFEQSWLRQNPLSGYVANVRKQIGPLKGMPGNEGGAQPAFPGGAPQTPTAPQISTRAQYDALAQGAAYMAPDGTIRHKQ